ncbi:cutinase family protein [Nocardia cyriacigeorgica]|uniref:Cutinase n=3 Tax=Nocardia TaxID=1817 RepID=A0A366CZA7_9NOCA|nr:MULTISPECIES: cutinase family protein [Nocardia]AVH20773.1 cutinase family protein [Nocardia cyriacigeorgica]MBF6188635.1 cutinase family protein [Nocardia farcinica]MBF6387686.1 cutinase family protein [Nocardia farcinica]MBF6422117.1 cutinase family protein [Nocardia farcinica]MBF6433773.1 cutinase family protein [Nocardia farcinica]
MRHNHSRTVRVALCAAVTATTMTAGVTAAEPTPDRTGSQCPRWTALLAPGTYETTSTAGQATTGILTQLGESLTARYGSDIEVHTLAPSAGAGSVSQADLTAAVKGLCSDTRVVVAGYGQGAEVAGDLATTLGNRGGPIPATRVLAVALVSDPRRDPATAQLGTPVSGQGVTGPRAQGFGELTDRVRTLCLEGDSYCSTTAESSPVLAAVSRALTTATTPAPTSTTSPTTTTKAPTTTTSTPTIRLGTGSTGQISVSQVLAQVVTVLNGLASFTANVPAIVADLAQLPGLITAGDVRGVHRVSGDLNNQFAPLVALADGLDLRLVAKALALAAPLDTTGVATIAAEIVGVLAGLDISRIATDVGRAQEIAWTAVEFLADGDPVTAVLTLTGLAPVAADLVSATTAAFTGAQLPTLTTTYTATTTGTSATGSTTSTTPALPDAQDGGASTFYASAAAVLTDWITQTIDQAK